ncbi:helix-turn-helix domain-containing protein [Actinomadura sp. NPDC049753]|uniref:helix-turn-helix transcriptional regulator n=1 Tax=Actinomadura sp. NPDC049753 TaxID=3154739 RepID=UPI0034409A72
MGNVRLTDKAAQQVQDAGVSARMSTQVDRTGDRLVPFEESAEITTLSPATLRWMRHRGEGPPFFKVGGRRLVVWESDLYAWIEAQAAKDQAVAR